MVQYYRLYSPSNRRRHTSLPNTVQTNRLITAINGWTPIQRYNAESSSSFKNKMMDEWAQELSNALKDFRGKLLAEEIKHQYYENLLNKVDTAVLVTDVTGHIEWMNQAAVTHLGQLSQLPEVLQEASTSNDISIIRIEQNGIVLEMAISCTTFVTQGAFATQSKSNG